MATVQPLAMELVKDVLGAMPEDPESFMMQWLRQRCESCERQPLNISLRQRNRALKEELSALQSEVGIGDTKVPVREPEASRAVSSQAELVSEVGTMRAETAADLTTSLEVRLLGQLEQKVERWGERLEARMLEVLNTKVEEVAASIRTAMGAVKDPNTGSQPEDTGAKPEHTTELHLRKKFGLGDSKYDKNIDLLRREVVAKAKYVKALEISGGEEKLRSFQVNFQPFFPTLDELFEFAHKHQHHFFDLVDRVGTATHGTCAKPPLKGKERCESKARFKYMDAAGNIEWHRLTDIVRDTLSYENLEDMYRGLKLIDEDKNVEIVEFNDRYQAPLDGGYRDLQLTLRVQGELVCELQLTTKYMLFIKATAPRLLLPNWRG
ncbi:ANKRD50 [Symbiodinium necroappetens]|uniref:ANKRD50 protein n=1 Tax=Symbiodinium necroappetens TaxID=1628268 RepID=A0A812RBB7_9DINO|nr:ANKRD50 [Symbiodinium necroappetens]